MLVPNLHHFGKCNFKRKLCGVRGSKGVEDWSRGSFSWETRFWSPSRVKTSGKCWQQTVSNASMYPNVGSTKVVFRLLSIVSGLWLPTRFGFVVFFYKAPCSQTRQVSFVTQSNRLFRSQKVAPETKNKHLPTLFLTSWGGLAFVQHAEGAAPCATAPLSLKRETVLQVS